MMKKIVSIVAIMALMVLLVPNASAADPMIEVKNTTILAGGYESASLIMADKGEGVDIKVSSDGPVNVYIMKNDDVPFMGTPDFSLAVYEKLDLTDTSFTFTIPDDDWYTLVIENPGTET
ncbi:MAG: hypothetical protein U9R75_03645, partial [Candidatus Thermoplasmatota archaeon]|nr:hypothetical protein [Candidatus Thermoplasmatota archaeon]